MLMTLTSSKLSDCGRLLTHWSVYILAIMGRIDGKLRSGLELEINIGVYEAAGRC